MAVRILLALLCLTFTSSVPINAFAVQDKSVWVGWWRNIDPATGGMTRVQFRTDASNLLLHAWGSCHPVECDIPERAMSVDEIGPQALTFTWNTTNARTGVTFAVRPTKITMLQNGNFSMEQHTHFVDGSRRADQDSVWEFARCAEPCVWTRQ